MKRIYTIVTSIILALNVGAAQYSGRVVDQNGAPVPYATVYPETLPEVGTATNNDGYFSFEAELPGETPVIISFIGYEKQILPLYVLSASTAIPAEVVLIEQPIALEETVVAAKASKQKNKRKQMAALLHAVYVKLEEEFPDEPARYSVVSDVRMNSEGNTWGMEQMIADIVTLPEERKDGRDSVQFHGRYCKRFFSAEKRAQADSILAGDAIERMEKKSKEKFMRKAVNAVDSGVVVHKALFSMGNMRYDFEQTMNDIKHWTVSNESEGETVLTHTEKISRFLGLFKLIYTRHYIIDSKTYAVRRFSEHAAVNITIPFGYKLNSDQVQMLNLLNMSEQQITRFRIKKANGKIDYNTIYQHRNGHVYTLEKNMLVNATMLGKRRNEGEKKNEKGEAEIPILIKATQRVTGLQTENVEPLSDSQITRRVKREIVEIY